MKARTVVEVTLTDIGQDEAEPVRTGLLPAFWPDKLRLKFYEDGRWYVTVEGRHIKADGNPGRATYKREWTGSDLTILPGWIVDAVTAHQPDTLTGDPA